MRGIESDISNNDKDNFKNKNVSNSSMHEEVSFWKFLDLEFDSAKRTFYLKAYYIQKPSFPNLFSAIVKSNYLIHNRHQIV
jgi:hypothetical protein